MNAFFLKNESLFFCLLIIIYLYFFQIKNYQYQSKENKLLYFLAFWEIAFAIVAYVVPVYTAKKLCFALCGLTAFLAGCLLCVNVIKMTEYTMTTAKKTMCALAGLVFGILTFYLIIRGFNALVYLLTFAIVALCVAEQNNKIKVDNLTKLYNRYGMDAELKEQLRQYEREHTDSFYIIACDLDNFKHINDTWGHPEGDRALILIARALSRVGKKFSSEVFRIGGDEFVIITDTSEEGLAADITNAIELELDNIDFRSDFDIEMSIGVALYDGVTPIDELLNNADKKLYEAKRQSKN